MSREPLEILREYREDASRCCVCHDQRLLHCRSDGRRARPLFHEDSSVRQRLVFVFEAPNRSDTYDADKGRITCDPTTDPSGRFMLELLAHVGLHPRDVVLTNAVLCLPAARAGKFPVTAAQRRSCNHWLERLIADLDPAVVMTCGAQALRAVARLERHDLKLREHAGRVHPWFKRKLLPLYHPSALGRVTRSRQQQLSDIEALLPFVPSADASDPTRGCG